MNKKKQLLAGCRKVKLADACEVTRGKPITAKSVTRGDIPVIAGGRTPAYYHNEANRPANTITVSGSGAYAGFVNYFDAPIFASDCSTVRSLNESEVATKFVYYFLVANQQLIYDKKRGAAQPHIYPSDLVDMHLPLPPPATQKEILALLNRQMAAVEKARLAAEEKTAAARLLPSALLREVFTYSENDKLPDGWRWAKLAEVCDILNSIRIPVKKADRISGPYPYYGATGIVDYVDSYLFDEKLILVGEDGAKWGRGENSAFIVEGKCWVNNHAHVLRAKKQVIPEYLAFALTDMDMLPHITGTTVPKLNQQKLREIRVAISPLTEQARIVSLLNRQMTAVETARLAAEEELRAINALPASLLREVFGVE